MAAIKTVSYSLDGALPAPTAEAPYTDYIPTEATNMYYYAVKAYLVSGRDSDFSNVVSADVTVLKDTFSSGNYKRHRLLLRWSACGKRLYS